MMFMIGSTTWFADDKAEYSASKVDNAISVCRNDFQINGQKSQEDNKFST